MIRLISKKNLKKVLREYLSLLVFRVGFVVELLPLWLLILPLLLQLLHPLYFFLSFLLLILPLFCNLLFPREKKIKNENYCTEQSCFKKLQFSSFILWFWFSTSVDNMGAFPLFHCFQVLQGNHFRVPISREGNGCSPILSVYLLNLSLVNPVKESSL